MPPGVGHYRPNLSNPFNQFPQSHAGHQNSHYQAQAANFHSHNLNNHASFGTPYQNGHTSIFGGASTNGAGSHNFGGAGVLGGAGGTGLASHEAQMRFAHGAVIQHHQAQDAASAAPRSNGLPTRIREVWRSNLEQEMAMIRNLVDKYPYVSMDTEFPGVVARPMGNFPSKADYHYQCLRTNVDLLKLIQLGITLWSLEGELPPAHADIPLHRQAYSNNLMPCPCTWTFNFQFSLEEDMYSEDSIVMLKKSGVDFEKNAEHGIDPNTFGALLTTSGLVLDPSVTWLSFHSGYDFGYLVKIMACSPLPRSEDEYLEIVRTWFPSIYDMKFLFRWAQKKVQQGILGVQATNIINSLGTKSGLQDIADELGCVREGRPHTAGSDAWLTGLVFWQIRQKIYDNRIPDDLVGMIWGLSHVGPPASAASQAAAMAGQQTPNINGSTLYHTGMTPSTLRSDAPTTPQTSHTGLASTPGPQHGHGGYQGQMAGGAFANFQYGR